MVTPPANTTGPSLPRLPTPTRIAHLESGNFSEFDDESSQGGASLAITTERAFRGTRSVKATHPGGDSFARAWYDVRWNAGSDVWYGAAFYVPNRSALSYVNLIRWDNFASYGNPGGDVGGLQVREGRARLFRSDYGGGNAADLGASFDIPQGRWFRIDIHQRFSAADGQALSEAYVDGRRVVSSRTANSRGRRIETIRFGYVSVEGPPSVLYFDEAWIAG